MKFKLSIKYKVYSLPFLSTIGLCFILFLTYQTTSNNNKSLENLYLEYYPLMQMAQSNETNFSNIISLFENAAIFGEIEPINNTDALYQTMIQNLNTQIKLNSTSANDQIAILDIYYANAKKVTLALVKGDTELDLLHADIKKMTLTLSKLKASLSLQSIEYQQRFEDKILQIQTSQQKNLADSVIYAILLMTLVLLISILITNSIGKNLSSLLVSMKDLAQGDGNLTKRIKVNSNDELAILGHYFNQFMSKLQNSIEQILKTAQPLAESSSHLTQLSTESKDHIQRQQDKSVIATESLKLLNSHIQAVSSSANNALSTTLEADNIAMQGMLQVQRSINAITPLAKNVERASNVIKQLDDDTHSVAKVLDVIGDIAEQTNLLALNAAIEAARAGEQGRGFAVVADEVRTLASRTQDSTAQIKHTIDKLQAAAKEAVICIKTSHQDSNEVVTEIKIAGEKLKTIVESVTRIKDINLIIAKATDQQTHSTQELSNNINEFSHLGDITSNSFNTLSKVGFNLSQYSKQLQEVSSQFKVN